MKTIQDILKGIDFKLVEGQVSSPISGLAFNSREVRYGYMFFAISGTQTDGHLYVEDAIKAGADCIIAEKPDSSWQCKTIIKVENSGLALSYAAANFWNQPSKKLKLIGVTGTNGKTTTVTLLHHLMMKMGYSSGLISTIRIFINNKEIPATHTTPDALTLNKLLAEMVDGGCQYAFMEVSSHAIVQKRTVALEFAGGIFTNITHDHLDYHLTFRNYLDAKKGFFDNLSESAFCLTNSDDRHSEYMVQNTAAKKFTYGLKNPADFKARMIESSLDGLHLKIGNDDFYTSKVGSFNAYNTMAVYAATMLLDIDKIKILENLSHDIEVPGRFQFVYINPDFKAIVDYAHTPDALENVLKTILESRKTGQRIITVFGCGGNRDKTKRPIMGKIAAENSDLVIVTSDNPRDEEPELIINEILKGIDNSFNSKVIVIADREQAIKTACTFADKNDVILVAGKGHENYQEIKGVKTHFDDKEVLLEYLKT